MPLKQTRKAFDIVIIGGLGHVGLPLGLSFANKNLKVCLYDVDKKAAQVVQKGIMPFIEYDAGPILKEVLKNGTLKITSNPKDISRARYEGLL